MLSIKRTVSHFALATALAATPMAIASAALAQANAQSDTELAIEEIVVTAQKREQNLQDVPAAIGTMNAQQLAGGEVNSFLDAAAQMPSVTFLQTGELRATVVTIRGIGSSSNNVGIEPSTTFMLDGEVMARTGMINSDLVDMERMEVLRGPQSTLFGKNASAGIIHYISKRPNQQEMEGSVTLKAAEDGEYKVNGVFSGPLSDKVAFRTSTYYSRGDGWVKNTYPGNENGGKFESWGIRQQLLFTPTDDLEILLRGEISRKESNCCASSVVRLGLATDAPGAVDVNPEDIQIRTSLDPNAPTVGLYDITKTQIGFDHGTTSMNKLQMHTLENKAASIEVNKQIGSNTLTYQGYYRYWNNEGNIDPWANAIVIYPRYFAGSNVAKTTQHELRLTSPGGEFIDYVGGLVYFRSDIIRDAEEERCSRADQGTVFNPETLEVISCRSARYVSPNGTGSGKVKPKDWYVLNSGDEALLDGLSAVGDVLYDFRNDYYTRMIAENSAIFGQFDIHPMDRLTLTLGGRLLHETTKLEYVGGRSKIEGWPDPALGEDNTTSDTAFTGKAALSYAWTDNIMTYASYSLGYKGVAWYNTISVSRDRLNQTPDDPNSGALAPEKPEQWEIGIRSQTEDGRLTLNATAFQINNDNFQERVSELDNDPNSPFYGNFVGDFRNIAIRSRGVELSLVAKPFRGWTFNVDGAYVDAEYREGFQNCPPDRLFDVAADQASAAPGQCFSTGSNPGTVLSLKGLQLANAIRFQYNIGVNYRFNLANSGGLNIGAKWRWKDGQQSRSDHRLGSMTDGYGIVDLGITYYSPDKNYKINLFVKNLLNNHYYSRLVPQPDWIGGGYRGTITRDFNRYFGAQATFDF